MQMGADNKSIFQGLVRRCLKLSVKPASIGRGYTLPVKAKNKQWPSAAVVYCKNSGSGRGYFLGGAESALQAG